MMSELGRETVSAYAAAKGGLKMLTRNIASEYGEYNIQCNGIGPGYYCHTPDCPLREIQPDGSRHPFDQFIIAKTPAARWGDTADLQGPAVFLASDASNFVNGLVLYVDGGILLTSASSLIIDYAIKPIKTNQGPSCHDRMAGPDSSEKRNRGAAWEK